MQQQEQVIFVRSDGTIQFVWDDSLAGLMSTGIGAVCRVAAVEPSVVGTGWMIDLTRIDRGLHGPFQLRGDALMIEKDVVNLALAKGPLKA